MFRLDRLEIAGFKSFADYTEIHFGEGITAIVGPNGCGKSNISEAICWVLGEQRAKTLRGNEMQDLIFQGTNNRPPSSMAEVILHLTCTQETKDSRETDKLEESIEELDEISDFDVSLAESSTTESSATDSSTNEDEKKSKRRWKRRAISINFAVGESISIARRLFRSGESEYFLNGKACRLRDIQDLLAGTGLSGARYAIIEQGYIGQILSAKPTERRSLIEEAAGISKFRIRQRMAEVRLENARLNLTRINDIIQEVEKQVSSLRRQASKTERYRKLKNSLRALLKQIFIAEGSLLMEKLEQIASELAEATSLEEALRKKLGEKEAESALMRNKIAETEAEIKRLESQRTEIIIQKNQNEKDLEHSKERIKNSTARRESIEKEKEETSRRLRTLEEEAETLKKKEAKETTEAEAQQAILRQTETAYKNELEKLRALEKTLSDVEAEKARHALALERIKELIRQHEGIIEKLIERSEGLMREGERAEKNFREYSAEIENLSARLQSLKENRQKLREIQQNSSEIREAKRKALELAKNDVTKIQQVLSQKQNLLETLEGLEAKGTIYEPIVQKIFAEQDKIGIKPLGILVDKLNVPLEAEKAVESVFGLHLQTILVSSITDALKLVEYLDKNQLGRIGILVVQEKEESGNGSKDSTKIGDLLGVSKSLASTLKEVFERECSAKLVETIRPESLNGEFLVDRKGNLAIGGKFFIGGSSKSDANSSLLVFKRRIRELRKEIVSLSENLKSQEEVVMQAQEALNQQNAELKEIEIRLNEVDKEILSVEVRLDSLNQEKQRTERHKRVVAEELKQIESEIEANRAKLKELESKAVEAQKILEKSVSEAAQLAEKTNQLKKSLEEKLAELNQKRMQAQIADERKRSITLSLKRIGNECAELRKRLAYLDFESKENQRIADESAAKIARLESAIQEEAVKIEQAEGHIREIAQELEKLRVESAQIEAEVAQLNKDILQARNKRSEAEIKQAEMLANLKNLNENCIREFGTQLSQIVEETEELEDFDLAEAHSKVREIRAKLEGLGAVNMLALEELEEAEKRLKFLIEQRNDILESIQDAQEALAEIKNRSRERFLQAFQTISENFTRIFSELFGGGRGEIRLIESEDVLESGVEIVAQPPGKRLQNVLLLSGGEKAMAAIALTLAIFECRPAPFCILDEVDAPLDDANVIKFTEKLKQMASKTQFLLITHNKKTMETAERLYGVTMQERGVSKIVSVKLS